MTEQKYHTCPHCETLIDSTAPNCSHCGASQKKTNPALRVLANVFITLAGVVTLVSGACFVVAGAQPGIADYWGWGAVAVFIFIGIGLLITGYFLIRYVLRKMKNE